MDENAVANLHLALADGVLSSIEEKKTAKNIWDHLARLYEARSLHNKIFLKRKLYALRVKKSTSVTEHRNNREDRQVDLRQVEALVVTRGRSMEPGSSGSHNHGNVASTSNDVNALCCETTVANEGRKRFADVWLFDTGATFHVTAKREWFHQYKSISKGRSVYSCNDHELKIIEIRSIMGKIHDGIVRTIQDVRHTKGLKKNLLSLGQLDDLGYKVEIQNKIMKIIKGALVLMKGEKIAANLYQLEEEIIEEAKASISSHSPSHIFVVSWNQKLRHMSEQGMKILVKKKLIPGLIKVSLPFCEYCVISEQHCLKFKASNSRSVFVLELVHSDVWQASVQSLGGAKYFVSFINDYSRRRWVYPIKKKCDVFEFFKVYKARVELDSGMKIKCLRTDNRGEYTGDEFDLFCRQEGIKRQFTTAYTPQQNRVAGRMNKTLLERARAMLATTSLGKPFWAEAIDTACYVINRSPSTAVELKTPMEMWTGKPVYYSDLYIFRSLVYDPTAHKVIVSRDVVFMEDNIQENEEGGEVSCKIVVKGYAQKEGIDFNDIFSPVVPMITVRVVLALCATRRDVGTRELILSSGALDITDYIQTLVHISRVKRGYGDVSNTVCISSRKFNVRDDLYKTRHCTCSGSSESVIWTKVNQTTGYVFTLSGRTVSWVSKVQSVVAMSTIEAEYVAVAQASKEAVWLKMLLEELGHKQEKITLF
nr:retrovirus-related Pol polyprotein from transposon TNT 1-94 [Tanacetum cinerariifolium]